MFLYAADFQQHEHKAGNQAIKVIWKVPWPCLTLPGSPCMNTAGSLERKRMGMLVEMDRSRKKTLPEAQERIKAARVPNWSANLVQKQYEAVRNGMGQVHPPRWDFTATLVSLTDPARGTDGISRGAQLPEAVWVIRAQFNVFYLRTAEDLTSRGRCSSSAGVQLTHSILSFQST